MNIYEIHLKCYHMEKMKEFYTNTLEMELINENEDLFSIMAGTTKMIFVRDEAIPFYHVCFRTNSQFYDYMFSKLSQLDILLPDENGNTSMFWKGKQAYFTDPDGNILEMLERPFRYIGKEPFGLFDVGEIGMPTKSVTQLQEELSTFIVDQYEKESETFAFFGDERGVFVIVKKGRHWYPTDRGAEIHPLKITISGNEHKKFVHPEYPYEIIVKKQWNEHFPIVQTRIARPTNQIEELVRFYHEGIGLEIIGEFRGHEGYDGVMLGMPDRSYHLEFTQHEVKHELPTPTKEHLLVFYMPNRYERDQITERLRKMGYEEIEPDNPYWKRGGITFADPDGYGVVLMNTAGI
jgi:catechol 2,3-dioxygenase-like lactoylglutathione lyase family enzyme